MIRVYAPASIGNVGMGFDVLGMAIKPINGDYLGDYVRVEHSNIFSLQNIGCFANQLPNETEKNIVFQCWKSFNNLLGKQYPPVIMQLEKNVPVSSGLGSSACSIVAALTAMNLHFGSPLNNNKLLMLMGEMEGRISGSTHFDNVSPCFLGGMRLVIQECEIISQNISTFDNWIWILAYPGIQITTEIARSVLPKQYSREDCISHSRLLSGFVHACYTQQETLAITCMKDIIAEPYRSQLFPIELSIIRDILIKKGAVSCGISGAGPTIFVLCKTEDVIKDITDWLSKYYLQNDSGFIKICSIDNLGARVVIR